MPAVPSGYSSGSQMNKPTCFDRIKIGFTMGFTVGMVTGIVFGGFAALRYQMNTFMSNRMFCCLLILDMVYGVVNFFQQWANQLSQPVELLEHLWPLEVPFVVKNICFFEEYPYFSFVENKIKQLKY